MQDVRTLWHAVQAHTTGAYLISTLWFHLIFTVLVCPRYKRSSTEFVFIMQLLVQTGVDKMPEGMVMKRWTRDARVGAPSMSGKAVPGGLMCTETMRALLQSTATDLVNACLVSRQVFELGIDFISRAKKAMAEMTVLPVEDSILHGVEEAANTNVEVGDDLVFGDISEATAPQRVRSRGDLKRLG